MKRTASRLIACALALCLTASMSVTAFAATAKDYAVNVSEDSLILYNNGKEVKDYDLDNTTIRLSQSKNGSLYIVFTRDDEDKITNVSLGTQKLLNISGDMDELTINQSVDNTHTISVDADVSKLTVTSPAQVNIASGARIGTLKAADPGARVDVLSGATVGKSSAVNGASIQGLKDVSALSDKAATETVRETKIETYVDISDDDDDDENENTKEISYSGTTIDIVAKSGIGLGAALKDVKLKVYRHDNDNKVSGSWAWVGTNSSTKESGTYTYRFTPTDANLYATIDLTVNYKSTGASRSIEKPEIEFADGQSSHGPKTTVTIEVDVPDNIEDDDKMTIYVDNEETDTYYFSEDDADEEMDFNVDISKSKAEAKHDVKIKVKIKRSSGGSAVSSKTLSYDVE